MPNQTGSILATSKDPQYDRIAAVLNPAPGKRGPKIKLTYDKYLQLISLLQNLISFDDAIAQIEIDDRTMASYMKLCPELSQVIARSQTYAKNLGKMQVVKLLSGKPARKLKKLDRAGNLVEIDVPEVDPPYQFVQWFMEHVDPDFANKPIDLNINVSDVMQRMLTRYAGANKTDTK